MSQRQLLNSLCTSANSWWSLGTARQRFSTKTDSEQSADLHQHQALCGPVLQLAELEHMCRGCRLGPERRSHLGDERGRCRLTSFSVPCAVPVRIGGSGLVNCLRDGDVLSEEFKPLHANYANHSKPPKTSEHTYSTLLRTVICSRFYVCDGFLYAFQNCFNNILTN